MAGLDLTSVAGIAAASQKGRLLQAISYEGKVKMPPTGKLPASVLSDFSVWVSAAAPMPEQKAAAVTNGWSGQKRQYWSFQPIRDFEPPVVKNQQWAQSTIDRFVRSLLEQKGLAPPKRADKLTLLRRANMWNPAGRPSFRRR